MSLPEDRLTEVESRLARIENILNIIRPTVKPDRAADVIFTTTTDTIETAKPEHPGNWLGIIAVICFVLAAAFIVKLSVDSGWLTPARQIGLAAFFGISLIGAGLLLVNTDRGYASYLPAAGIIVLYITVFAAHIIDGLISFHAAINLDCILSGLCIYIYCEMRHDVYILTSAVGAYAAPFVLAYDSYLGIGASQLSDAVITALTDATVFTIYYFMCCSLIFTVIGILARSRTLTMISAYLAIMATALVGFYYNSIAHSNNTLMEIVLIVQFLIFSIGTSFYTYINKAPLTALEASSYFPVLVLFYVVEYVFINQAEPGLAPWLSLGFAVFLIGLYQGAKKWFPAQDLNSKTMILAFATLVFVHSFYIVLLPDAIRPWLFVLFALAYAFIPDTYLQKTIHTSAYRIPLFAIGIIGGIEYVEILVNMFDSEHPVAFGLWIAAFASVWVAFLMQRHRFIKNADSSDKVLAIAHLLGICMLYRFTLDYGSLAVSVSWLVYAILVMAFAITRHDQVMAKSSIFILAFAAGKVLLYDVASAPTLVRIVCLLVTGIVLYGAGLFLRKISEWK
jgi:hypothetical protein